MMKRLSAVTGVLFAALLVTGCPEKKADTPTTDTPADTADTPKAPELKAGPGVDLEKKVVRIGTLDDLSGPGAAIGKPYAQGKRLLAARINAGGSGLLPEGWTVELVERDHGYNPTNAIKAYKEIREEILFLGTTFGTPNTLPLMPHLEADKLVAFPASLSSKLAENKHTPPIGTPYKLEAERAMDWAVEQAGGADKVKAGIVYQQDDYGADGLAGWEASAARHGVEIVSKQAIAPGQKDFAATITGLKDAGATHVLLTTLPSATGPVLGTAAQLKYMPIWIGNTPSWVDIFFEDKPLPNAVMVNFHWVIGLPFWGEPSGGMTTFLEAFEKHGGENKRQDFYTLVSYLQGLVQIEALNRAIAAGDVTREGYLAALGTIEDFSGDGLTRPMNMKNFPYRTSDLSRVLKPDFEKKSWTVVSDFAAPGAAAPAAPADEEPADEAPAE
ncbi:MAG: ABC transporter substrate-binding protein [Deltaproteobacteria bacterium]|nr:ABC transporter substrate-binding protein [Deltaproteobacteria bacterium]